MAVGIGAGAALVPGPLLALVQSAKPARSLVTQFAVAVVRFFCGSHQELPSQSANLSRLDTFPSLNVLSSEFGTGLKNFNS